VIPHHAPVGGFDDAGRQRSNESPVGVGEIGRVVERQPPILVCGFDDGRRRLVVHRPDTASNSADRQMFAEVGFSRLNRELNFWRIHKPRSQKSCIPPKRSVNVDGPPQQHKENRVKRSVTVAAAATAIFVVGLSGCSSNKSSTSGSGSSSGQSSAVVTGPGGAAAA